MRLYSRSVLGTLFCAALGMVGWLAPSGSGAEQLAFGTAILLGGVPKALNGLRELIRGRVDVDLLMVLGAVGAAALGQWGEGALLIFIFSLSGSLEELALDRTQRSIAALVQLHPERARLVRDGKEVWVAADAVRVGERVIVKAGERIPVDGIVIRGSSEVDQSPITGESVPVAKLTGDWVYAGTINGQGYLEIRTERPAADSTVARIALLVKQARAQAPRTQRLIERVGSRYSAAVVLGTGVLLGVFVLGLGWPFSEAFRRSLAVLVVASPCALAVSATPAVLSAIGAAARAGVLFKGGQYVEALARLDVMAFDKTGTLTPNRLEVRWIVPLREGVAEDRLLRTAAALERGSNHPIAQGLVQAAQERGLLLPEPEEVHLSGQGIAGRVEGRAVQVGNLRHFEQVGVGLSPSVRELVAQKQMDGYVALLVAEEGELVGMILLSDGVRPEAALVVERLRRQGIQRAVLLTGDQPAVARQLAAQVAVDAVYSELLPEDKSRLVREWQRAGFRVGFVGDGVNDAPALAVADVGIAMGGAGTDAALETADVVLMGDDLRQLVYAHGLSRFAFRLIRQNVIFALGTILVLLLTTAITGLPLAGAVLGHETSTVLVAFNGLRALRYRQAE